MWKWVTGFWIATLVAFGAEPKRLRVVTTILPVYCFASGVIGTNGVVQNLLPPNVGPHDYQPTPSDLRKLKDADLIILNGLGIDNWVIRALSGAEKNRVLELGKAFQTELIQTMSGMDMAGDHAHGHDHQHGPANPHIWLDPQLAIRCVTNILSVVQKLDPTNAAQFAANASIYTDRLRGLDSEIALALAAVREKPLITQHDAFPYFIRRYQLKLAGVIETTPEVQPSPRYLADLMKVIREKKVGVLFYDPAASPRLVKRIANDVKIRAEELPTLESGVVQPDAYERGLRQNAETLRRELAR